MSGTTNNNTVSNNSKTLSVNNFNLTVTESAYNKLASVLTKKDTETYFRIKITSGGCSGFSTVFELDTQYNQQEDLMLNFGNKIKIIVHQQVAELIGTAELNYKQDLLTSYFALTVAEAKDGCSCGSSFSL